MTCILLAGTLNNKFVHLVVLLSDIQKFRRAALRSHTFPQHLKLLLRPPQLSSFLIEQPNIMNWLCKNINGCNNQNAFWKSLFLELKLFSPFERVDGV